MGKWLTTDSIPSHFHELRYVDVASNPWGAWEYCKFHISLAGQARAASVLPAPFTLHLITACHAKGQHASN